MSKFSVRFDGYPDDLLAELGMSMNDLIRRIAGGEGTKPVRSTFVKPENANVDWLRENILHQITVAIWQKPKVGKGFSEIKEEVRRTHLKDIDEWIEEKKALLAEIGFLKD